MSRSFLQRVLRWWQGTSPVSSRRDRDLRRRRFRQVMQEVLEGRQLLAVADPMYPWHNATIAADVSGDNQMTQSDYDALSSYLMMHGPSAVSGSSPQAYDVVPNNYVDSNDLSAVSSALSSGSSGTTGATGNSPWWNSMQPADVN